jgi:predicted aldo/keto reductase-like oxidoreductase
MSVPKRKLGKTGEQVSILGLGGFHLLEVSDAEATDLINRYLDEGGNYIETAAEYGGGESERKIGPVMAERRDECFLVTKCHIRNRKGASKTIEESLRRLQTDHVDLLLLHHVLREEELEQIYSRGGAMEAFLEAKKSGKARYLGITGHGQPDVLIKALEEKPHLDALMTGFNFYDRFNFPGKEQRLIPLAKDKGVALIGMKAFADGLLWEYPEESLGYTLSLPIDVLACGFNTMAMLETDLEIVRRFKPMSEKEKQEIFTHNPVLSSSVCRLCDECLPCPEGINIPKVFLYEGWYDRQMRDRRIRSTPEFALRDRLRFWFDDRDLARQSYSQLDVKADACTACGDCSPRCPFGLDIIAKLDNTHYKLTREVTSSVPI